MAEKRFISKRLTESEKFRRLANERCDLACILYQAHFPHLDRDGRMKANPTGLASTIWEGYAYTPGEIDKALHDMARVGLVYLYSNGRHSHIVQYTKFLASDGGFNTPHPKEPVSDLPGPFDAGSVLLEPGPGINQAKEPGKDAGNLPGKHAGNPPGNDPVIALHCSAGTGSVETNPPTPQEREEEFLEVELSRAERAVARKADLSSHLTAFHRPAFEALVRLRKVHPGRVTDEQFKHWSRTVLDDCREHGEAHVVATLEATIDGCPGLNVPWKFYRKRVKDKSKGERVYEDVSGADLLEAVSWN